MKDEAGSVTQPEPLLPGLGGVLSRKERLPTGKTKIRSDLLAQIWVPYLQCMYVFFFVRNGTLR